MSTAVAIKRTGEMMLQGWKMLATACPICHTALMSKSGNIRCPSCDVPVKQAKDVAPDSYTEHMITETPKTPSSSGPAPAPAAGKSVAEPTSYEEMKKEYDAKNKKRNDVSAKLGERMITGWTLLGDSCPNTECEGTPLMKLGKGHMQCVACEKEYAYSPDGGLEDVNKVKTKVSSGNAVSAAAVVVVTEQKPVYDSFNDPEFEEYDNAPFDFDNVPMLPLMSSFAVNKDDASYKISQKLLMGWTLLDKVCSIHHMVPLMKDHDGHLVCVECPDEKGQTSGHILPPAPQQVSANSVGTDTASAGRRMRLNVHNKMAEGFHHSDDELEDEDDEEGDLDKFYAFQGSSEIMSKQRKQQQQQQPSPSHESVLQSTPTSTAATATAVRKENSCAAVCNDEYSSTLQTLREKLREVSLQLAGCSISGGGIDKAQQLAKLIGDLAQAIKAIESIVQ